MSTRPPRRGQTTCDVREALCVCHREFDHEGPHQCDCAGEWTYDADGELVALRLPSLSALLDSTPGRRN